jgi:hypothetical protein
MRPKPETDDDADDLEPLVQWIYKTFYDKGFYMALLPRVYGAVGKPPIEITEEVCATLVEAGVLEVKHGVGCDHFYLTSATLKRL